MILFFPGTILSCTVILLMLVNLVGGQSLLVTEDSVTFISDNFNEEGPYKLSTKFPDMCTHVPANCRPILFSLGNDSLLLIPSYGFVKYFKLTNSSVEYSSKLSLKNCIRYVSTGKGNNEFYAICLKNQTQEMTTVTYKVRYTKNFELEVSKYGYGYGTRIDVHSPLIETFSDSSDPVVLYINDAEDGAELFIKDLNAGGDVCDRVVLPSDCTAPHELRHLHQLNALLKCSNGLLYLYDGNTIEFTKLPVKGIAMVERCTNSSFFVMVTNQGNILLNKSANNLMRISFLKITIDLLRLDALSSFSCFWNGTATIFYFTVSQDNGMVYYMNITLEYVAESKTSTEAHQMLKSIAHDPLHVIQSNIVGSAWINKLTDEDDNFRDAVFINIKTGSTGSYLLNGPAYVLPYQDQPFHLHSDTLVKDETTSEEPENSRNPQTLTIVISISVCSVVVVAVIGLYCLYHRKQRESSYSPMREEGNGGPSVANECETAFNDEGDEAPTRHTVSQDQNNTGVSGLNNSQTVEEGNRDPPNPSNADQNPQIVNSHITQIDLNTVDLTTTDIPQQTAADSNPQVDHDNNAGNTLVNRFNYPINLEFIPMVEEASNRNNNNSREARVTGVFPDTAASARTSTGNEDNSPYSDDETTDP